MPLQGLFTASHLPRNRLQELFPKELPRVSNFKIMTADSPASGAHLSSQVSEGFMLMPE